MMFQESRSAPQVDNTRWGIDDWPILNAEEIPSPPPLSPQLLDKASEIGFSPPETGAPVASNFPMYQHAPTSAKRKRMLKQLRFAQEALLYPTQWTENDIATSWYSSDELAEFKQERRETVRHLKRVGFDLQKIGHECLRGFEPYYSLEMNRATKYARDLVMNVVFVEQHRQRINGLWDTESMRVRSSNASQWARNNAQELASTDAQESSIILREMSELQQPCCIGLPYCHHAGSIVAGSPSLPCPPKTPTHIGLVDQATVLRLENALRAVKDILSQA